MVFSSLAASCCRCAEKPLIPAVQISRATSEPDLVLKDCATSAAHFFDAPSRSQLDDVFEEIGKRAVELRLSS